MIHADDYHYAEIRAIASMGVIAVPEAVPPEADAPMCPRPSAGRLDLQPPVDVFFAAQSRRSCVIRMAQKSGPHIEQ